ncbi:MAG TPA: hypothetical protein VIT67_12455, partial [Povalibacter sp.]
SYSFVLLDELVMGRTQLSVFAIEMLNPIGEHRAVLCLVFTIGVFFGTDAALYWLGLAGAIAIGVLVLGIVPAVVAIQGATGSAAQSMNPVRWWRLMNRLGGDYLWMVAVCGGGVLMVMLGEVASLPRMLRIAVFMYAWFSLLAVIGGVLHERRSDLRMEDIDVLDIVQLDDTADIERARQHFIDLVYAEWRGGSHRNAWQTVVARLDASEDAVAELRWLYQRTIGWPDSRLAHRVAQELVPRLLTLRHNGEALDITRERLSTGQEFRPLASADLIRLAELARDAGDRSTARRLLLDFSRFYPHDPPQLIALLQQQLER